MRIPLMILVPAMLLAAGCSDDGAQVTELGSDTSGPQRAVVEMGGGDEDPRVVLTISCAKPAEVVAELSGFTAGDVTLDLGDVRTTTVLAGPSGVATVAVAKFEDSNTLTVADTDGHEVSESFDNPCPA